MPKRPPFDPSPTPPTLSEELGLMTIREAAAKAKVNPRTIRQAIKNGELEATVVGGRDPIRSGRGLGYRITQAALQKWFFGSSAVPADG